MEDLTGKQFGAYQLMGSLGEGGMAAVYKGYQPSMERYVALKVLPRGLASDPQFVSRFEREAKLVAQLQHPHILPVFDYGEADGYTYIVMPFVQTGTLSGLLKGKPVPLEDICRVISQVGEALNYAHGRGLIHRDVKPSNILIDESGNCLLTDFGLAKMTESAVSLTATGTVMGTPAYMSPEQGSGAKVDARSDIYSLGIILYEMATGRVPYKAETPLAVIYKHIQDPLPPARKINPKLSEAVERVILKSLSKDPEQRYQHASDMVAALLKAAAEDTTPRVPVGGHGDEGSDTTHFASAPRRLPSTLVPAPRAGVPWFVWVGVAGVLVLLLVGGGYLGLRGLMSNRTQATQAVSTSSGVVAQATLPRPTSAPAISKPATAAPTARPLPSLTPARSEVLVATGELRSGQQLQSVSGRFVFRFQSDGNLQVVDQDTGKVLWSSRTQGTNPERLVMQDDGNLVLYGGANSALWSSKSAGSQGDYFLIMQDDGNLVIHRGVPYGQDTPAVWATGTSG